jgi:hypothetical protein
MNMGIWGRDPVGLNLHERCTIEQAVAAFEPAAPAEFLCEQQFIVLDKAVICMATVGDPATQPHLSSASCVIWKSDRIGDIPRDERWYLHDKITDAWVPNRQIRKEHHVFLRLPTEERFFYAGKAHLGSWSATEANFTLNQKLPREKWLRLGGYPGWLIDVSHRSERVDNGDLAKFRRLAREVAGPEFSHLSMTRFEEDVLTLSTNARRGWLMYQLDPADCFYSGCDPDFAGDHQVEELFRCDCGIQMDCSADHTVPRDKAMRIVEEFFVTGELPRTLRWSSG